MKRPIALFALLLSAGVAGVCLLSGTSEAVAPTAPPPTPTADQIAAPVVAAATIRRPTQERRTVADGVYAAAIGSELRFAAACDARTTLRGGDRVDEQTLEIAVDGTLAVLVVDRRGRELVCEVRLEDGAVRAGASGRNVSNAALEAALRGGSLLRMDADGRLLGLRFGSEVTPGSRGLVRTLVTSLGAVVPADAGDRWQTVEADPTGAAQVTYQRVDREITRRKRGYVVDAADANMPDVVGDGRIVVSSEHGWIGEVAWRETAELVLPEAAVMIRSTIESRADLEGVTLRDARELPDADWDGPWSPICGADDGATSAARLEADGWSDALRGESVASLTGRLADLVAAGTLEGIELFDACEALAWLLRLRPAALADLEQVLARPDLDPRLVSILLGAVGAAGTDAAQGMLASWMAEPARTEEFGVATALALFEVTEPTPRVVSAAVASVQSPAAPGAVAGTSLLALGAFGAKDGDAFDSVLGLEVAARERGLLIDWLQALGNSGRPEVVAAVARHLIDADPEVRAAATEALRLVDTAAAMASLARIASDDPATRVRAVALELLAERAGALGLVGGLLQREVDAMVRRAAVLGLGRSPQTAAVDLLRRTADLDADSIVRELALELLAAR